MKKTQEINWLREWQIGHLKTYFLCFFFSQIEMDEVNVLFE